MLHGGGHEEAGVLADMGKSGDEATIPGDEGGAVAGEVGLLRQRIQGEQAARICAAHLVGKDRWYAGAQVGLGHRELRVALIGCNDDAPLAGSTNDAAQFLGRKDVAVRIARRIDPHEARLGGPGLRPTVARVRGCARKACAHVVGGIGRCRVDDDIALPEPQEGGQQRHHLFAADRR